MVTQETIPTTGGYVLRPGEGVPGADASVKASRRTTGGAFTLIESRTGGGAPRHTHSREDEAFYVLAGTITVGCGDESFIADSGSFVFLPRGIPHEWDVVGAEATVLMMTMPGGLDDFLAELHAPDSDRAAVAARYGIAWGDGG